MTGRQTLGVAVLTYNEEANLRYALDSVRDWADKILVLDSGSTDRTLDIAKEYPAEIVVHPFESYGKQRNKALQLLRSNVEWVLFLDADETVPESLRSEIDQVLTNQRNTEGYYLKYRLIWEGHWIRRGYYPTWILRLVKSGSARCEERAANEHLIVAGPTGRLRSDFFHYDRKGIGAWIEKHNRYATAEASEIYRSRSEQQLEGRFFGKPPQRRRWVRETLWNRLPPITRSFAYFGYRYFLRGGFLDGRPGLVFHFLQGLWYPLLIDLKYLEKTRSAVAADAASTSLPRVNEGGVRRIGDKL